MLHVSSKWKCCFRFTADKTLRTGARLLCIESLRLEKDLQDGVQPFWAAVSPQSCLLHEGMDINGDNRLHQVRVLQTWQLFQLLE